MISAIFILDFKGRVIISRDYRGDISQKCSERFMTKINELEGDSKLTPVIYDDAGVSYVYLTVGPHARMYCQHGHGFDCTMTPPLFKIQVSNLYIVAVSRSNSNVASIVQFLHRLVDVFKHYFQELEEESLRDNFVIVYELLDEVCDFGYPQFTEAKILQEYIKTDAYKMEIAVKPPMAVTNAVSWRTEGIKYKKNEVGDDVFVFIS